MLENVNKLIEIGEEFSGTPAVNLRDCLKNQSIDYFKHFHKKKIEDLFIMLENEMWQKCPVAPGFSVNGKFCT